MTFSKYEPDSHQPWSPKGKDKREGDIAYELLQELVITNNLKKFAAQHGDGTSAYFDALAAEYIKSLQDKNIQLNRSMLESIFQIASKAHDKLIARYHNRQEHPGKDASQRTDNAQSQLEELRVRIFRAVEGNESTRE